MILRKATLAVSGMQPTSERIRWTAQNTCHNKPYENKIQKWSAVNETQTIVNGQFGDFCIQWMFEEKCEAYIFEKIKILL